jgi:serine/threonine protein phosphatase 1
VPLKAQAPEDLMWIREPFLSDREQRDVVVVHGHTPKPEPEVLENRIGIDTGAVMGGKLTCLVLEDDRYRFIMK